MGEGGGHGIAFSLRTSSLTLVGLESLLPHVHVLSESVTRAVGSPILSAIIARHAPVPYPDSYLRVGGLSPAALQDQYEVHVVRARST